MEFVHSTPTEQRSKVTQKVTQDGDNVININEQRVAGIPR